MKQYYFFSYKFGNSFLHRCPAWIKILLIPILNVCVFKFPFQISLILIFLQTVTAFILKFSVKEILTDLKPVLYYAVLLLFAKFFGNLFAGFFSLATFFSDFWNFIISEKETGVLLLKLLCMIQTASLFFKTSTSLQLREGFENIEFFIRRIFHLKKATPVAQVLSIFVTFIPIVAKNWQQITLAWYARGGKKSVKMIIVLLPVFFSVGMKQAYNSARAISIRS